mgnify:CR=1 FL=1
MVKTHEYIPSRGDVILINCDPQSGQEQSGFRPSLVLSQYAYNKATGMVLVCPITSSKGLHKLQIEIPEGFKVSGVIIADQIKSFDFKERNGKEYCKLPDKFVLKIVDILSKIIGFNLQNQ